MKNYQADSIRNIAVLGHGGEGKTTLTEAMLFNAGLLDRMGKVDDGTTVSDYDPEDTFPSAQLLLPLSGTEPK